MLIDAILKLHHKIQGGSLGVNAEREEVANDTAALRQLPLIDQTGLLRRDENSGQNSGMFGVEDTGDTSGYGGVHPPARDAEPHQRRRGEAATAWPLVQRPPTPADAAQEGRHPTGCAA